MTANHGGRVFEAVRRWGGEPKEWLDFSANINPLGLNPLVAQAIHKEINQLIHYPDNGGLLKSLLAREHGVEPEQIILTNGAAEALFVAINGMCPQSALLLEPTFSEYRRALAARKVPTRHIILDTAGGFQLPWREVKGNWSQGMLLVVCNPNNPTGVLAGLEELRQQAELAREHEGWLLVDESFQDFLDAPPTMMPLLNARALVVRSLTKFFALPGLRLGYIVASRETAAFLAGQVPGWNVNALALVAGAVALQQREYIEETREMMAEARAKLYRDLASLEGIEVYPPTTNFILFRLEGYRDLPEFLAGRRILIRNCSDFHGLGKDWYRCAVRAPAENDKLVEAIKMYWGEKDKDDGIFGATRTNGLELSGPLSGSD